MKYLLDTNTCIRFLNARSEALVERLSFTPDEQICVCSIVKAEMFFGSIKSRDPVRTRAIQERFFLDILRSSLMIDVPIFMPISEQILNVLENQLVQTTS